MTNAWALISKRKKKHLGVNLTKHIRTSCAEKYTRLTGGVKSWAAGEAADLHTCRCPDTHLWAEHDSHQMSASFPGNGDKTPNSRDGSEKGRPSAAVTTVCTGWHRWVTVTDRRKEQWTPEQTRSDPPSWFLTEAQKRVPEGKPTFTVAGAGAPRHPQVPPKNPEPTPSLGLPVLYRN